jgi:hypothetical protein
MQNEALRLAIEQGTRLDTKTINAIAELVRSPTARTRIFDDLTRLRGLLWSKEFRVVTRQAAARHAEHLQRSASY